MRSVRLLPLLWIAFFAFIPGCGGSVSTSTSNPAPTVPGTPAPPNPSPTASSTFVYVANTGSGDISTFKLADDGSLAPVAGSPMAVSGVKELALSTTFLLATRAGTGASSYKIDPASGALAHVADATIASNVGLADIVADSSKVYVASGGIFAFSLSNGQFTSVPGSPFFVPDPTQPFAPNVEKLLLDSAGSWLFAGFSGDRVSGTFAAMPRAADGSISADKSISIGPTQTDALAEHPSRKFLYVAGDGFIGNQSFNATTGQHNIVPSSSGFFGSGIQMAISPNGKFLVSLDFKPGPGGEGEVHVYVIDQNSGLLTSEVAGSPIATKGIGPSGMTLDPSGRFILVVHGNSGFVQPSNDISVLSFDANTGEMKLIGSPQPVGKLPDSVVAVKF